MPRPGNDVFPLDERRLMLDGRSFRLSAFDVAHNGIYGLHDYDFPDRHLLRSFCTSSAIQWSAFDNIRSDKAPVKLTEAEKRSVAKDFATLTSSGSMANSVDAGHNNNNNNKNNKNKNDSFSNGKSCEELSNILGEPQRIVSRILADRIPELCPMTGDTPLRGSTFLLLSAVTGDVELARRCVELGANPNNMNFLSDPDVPVNQMQHGYSPMFVAVLAGQMEVMQLLHHMGGSLHVYDRWGRSPLHAAVAMENAAVVQWLLSKGAPRCIGCPPPDTANKTPMTPSIAALVPRPVARRVETTESKEEEKEGSLCQCQSGRPRGFCGCMDDMFERWSYDRLQSKWYTGRDLSAIAAKVATTTRDRAFVGR